MGLIKIEKEVIYDFEITKQITYRNNYHLIILHYLCKKYKVIYIDLADNKIYKNTKYQITIYKFIIKLFNIAKAPLSINIKAESHLILYRL